MGWTTLLISASCLHGQYQCQGEGHGTFSAGFHLSLLTDLRIWATLFRQIRCFLALPSNIHPLPGAPAWDEAMPKGGCLDYHPVQIILLNTLSSFYNSFISIGVSKPLDTTVPEGDRSWYLSTASFYFQAWALKVTAWDFFSIAFKIFHQTEQAV